MLVGWSIVCNQFTVSAIGHLKPSNILFMYLVQLRIFCLVSHWAVEVRQYALSMKNHSININKVCLIESVSIRTKCTESYFPTKIGFSTKNKQSRQMKNRTAN